MEGIKERVRLWFVAYLTRHLVKGLTEHDILTIANRSYLLNKRKLSPEEIANLKDDAKHFSESILWELMRKDIEFLAYLNGSRKAKSKEEFYFSSAMFYSLQILEQFLDRIKRNL